MFPSLITQHQYFLMKFMKRTIAKKDSHLTRGLLRNNLSKARFTGASGSNSKGNTRPYHLRSIALEIIELLGNFKSAQKTHQMDRKWSNPTKIRTSKINKECMHFGYVDWAFNRNPDKGLASLV